MPDYDPFDEIEKTIAKITAAAWEDSDFLGRLLQFSLSQDKDKDKIKNALQETLKQKGIALPPSLDNIILRFVANTADTRYVIIPEKPKFTDEDLGPVVEARRQASDCTGCDKAGGGGFKPYKPDQ